MLWKKESNKLYADICASARARDRSSSSSLFPTPASTTVKNDQLSAKKRAEGNEWFRRKDWHAAMQLYNESLCLATPGSENISLAYSNRSACFFNMKMYEKCLVDVELSKKAGCPARLMPKLNQRETDCLELIEKSNGQPSNEFHPKLSFDADEKFPCMANVLKLNRNANGEYSLVAKEDIEVGKTVIVEDIFLKYLYMFTERECNICLKEEANLMPCTKCTVAMFCSGECQGNILHKYECGLKLCDDTEINGPVMVCVRVTLLAIDLFSNADELMNFVEQTLQSNHNELLDSLLDERSKYRAFLKLHCDRNFAQKKELPYVIFEAYKLLMKVPKVKEIFQTVKHSRFMMHLIGHHIQIINDNASSVHPYSPLVPNAHFGKSMSSKTAIISNHIKLSCIPNVVTNERDNVSVCTTIRPVKKGEDLLVILSTSDLLESKEVRQQHFFNRRQKICKCTRCEGFTASSEQRQQLRLDPDFHHIYLGFSAWMQFMDGQKGQAIAAKCIKFLQKHGHIMWCDELGQVLFAYMMTHGAPNCIKIGANALKSFV